MTADKMKELSDQFGKHLLEITRNAGTEKAEFDCEICGAVTFFSAFTAFMYPDFSIKALCNKCGGAEYLRLDYSNKN